MPEDVKVRISSTYDPSGTDAAKRGVDGLKKSEGDASKSAEEHAQSQKTLAGSLREGVHGLQAGMLASRALESAAAGGSVAVQSLAFSVRALYTAVRAGTLGWFIAILGFLIDRAQKLYERFVPAGKAIEETGDKVEEFGKKVSAADRVASDFAALKAGLEEVQKKIEAATEAWNTLRRAEDAAADADLAKNVADKEAAMQKELGGAVGDPAKQKQIRLRYEGEIAALRADAAVEKAKRERDDAAKALRDDRSKLDALPQAREDILQKRGEAHAAAQQSRENARRSGLVSDQQRALDDLAQLELKKIEKDRAGTRLNVGDVARLMELRKQAPGLQAAVAAGKETYDLQRLEADLAAKQKEFETIKSTGYLNWGKKVTEEKAAAALEARDKAALRLATAKALAEQDAAVQKADDEARKQLDDLDKQKKTLGAKVTAGEVAVGTASQKVTTAETLRGASSTAQSSRVAEAEREAKERAADAAREEAARAEENKLREMELSGAKPDDLRAQRGRVAKARLPADATPEQRRAAELAGREPAPSAKDDFFRRANNTATQLSTAEQIRQQDIRQIGVQGGETVAGAMKKALEQMGMTVADTLSADDLARAIKGSTDSIAKSYSDLLTRLKDVEDRLRKGK